MGAKKTRKDIQSTKRQDTPALPHHIDVGALFFSYLIAAEIIMCVTAFTYTANSGYFYGLTGAGWMIGSLFFKVPLILFIILLTVACTFVFAWGFKNQKQKQAYATAAASLLLIPLFALATSHTITQTLALLPTSEAERIACYTSPHHPDDDIRWVDNECWNYRTIYYLTKEIPYSNREIKGGEITYTLAADTEIEGVQYKAGDTITKPSTILNDSMGTVIDTCGTNQECHEGKLGNQETYVIHEKSIRQENSPLAVGSGYTHANVTPESVVIGGVKYVPSSYPANPLPSHPIKDEPLYVKQ